MATSTDTARRERRVSAAGQAVRVRPVLRRVRLRLQVNGTYGREPMLYTTVLRPIYPPCTSQQTPLAHNAA